MSTMPFRIRRARALVSLSQVELAQRVGVQRSAVTQWEQRNGTHPSVEHLAGIASETGVCFEWLATGRGPSHLDASAFESAVIMNDYAQNEVESRVLTEMRRLSPRKQEALIIILEALA